MPQYIYSERWIHLTNPPLNPYVQSGRFDSPTFGDGISGGFGELNSRGSWEDDNKDGLAFNGFDPADSVLLRRVRFWSPCLGLGLAGASTKYNTNTLRIYAFTRNQPSNPLFRDSGPILIQSGMALGEWVDLNMTLAGPDIANWAGEVWGLRGYTDTPLTLDSSRMAADLVGAPNGAFLNFQLQIELAHTLPAVQTSWDPPV